MNAPITRTLGRCVLFAAAVLTAGPPIAAQKRSAPHKVLRAALRKLDVDPATAEPVVAAVESLGKRDEARTVKLLLDAAVKLNRRAAEIGEKRRKILLGDGGSGRLARSRYELLNIETVSESIAVALEGLRQPDAVRSMLAATTRRARDLPLWLRLRMAARVGELPTESLDWQDFTGEKKRPTIDALLATLASIGSIGPRAAEATGPWVLKQLAHERDDVRVQAAGTLARLAWHGGIEALIDRLDAERGATLESMLDALVALTGQSPGASARSWRAWRSSEGGPFVRGERPLGERAPKPPKRAKPAPANATSSGSYFGIPQNGASVLYLFDNSLSMRAKMGGKKKAAGDPPDTGPVAATRWVVCKRELKRALGQLRPTQKFNLVSFANRALCFDETMREATPENVDAGIAWIDGLKLEFQTNVYDALDLAFQLAGRGVDDRYYVSDVDTIFFLSDGAPTMPKWNERGIRGDDPEDILRAVRRWNALSRVTVHTIGFGLQAAGKDRSKNGRLRPAVFLRRLAEQNQGRHVLKR